MRRFTLVFLTIAAVPALAQKPTITGIVNAASYAAPTLLLDAIAPGSIATIFGTNLSSQTLTATSLPLPTQLADMQVKVDGVPAPLLFLSPNQINFQVSWRYLNSAEWRRIVVPQPDGAPAPFDPPIRGLEGIGPLSGAGELLFAGLAPGLVGVYQVNLRLGPDTPQGCAVPIVSVELFNSSRIASISVHAGGGHYGCHPHPQTSLQNCATPRIDSERLSRSFLCRKVAKCSI